MHKHGAMPAIWIIIAITLLLVGGIAAYFIVSPLKPGSVVGAIPAQCSIDSSELASGSYKCPADASSCSVTVELACNTKVSSPKVIFRTQSLDLRGGANRIAWDVDSDGDLDCFVKGGNPSPSANIPFQNSIRLPQRMGEIKLYGNTQQVFAVKDESKIATGNYIADPDLRYFSGSGCQLSSSPIDPNFEVTEGDLNSYVCEQKVTGSKTVTVKYVGNQPGTKKETFILSPNQQITWTDKITSQVNRIKQSECTINQPASSGPSSYFACKQAADKCGVLEKVVSFCEDDLVFIPSTGKCGVPYTLAVSTDKAAYGVGEAITGTVELKDTTQRSFIEITVKLLDVVGSEKAFAVVSTNANGKAVFSLAGQQAVGTYRLTAQANHPLGSAPTDPLAVQVSQPIFLRLSPFPDKIQYTSNAVQAKAFVTDNQGQARDAASWDLTGTKCGTQDVSTQVQISRLGRTSQGTEYLLSTPVSQPCTFVYKAIAIDNSGFKSAPDAVSIDVKASEVRIVPELTNIQDKDAGRHTIKFKTLDTNNQPINTIATVIVTDSDSCRTGEFCLSDNKFIPATAVSGQNGEYQFTHSFKDGLNEITITASASGLQSTTQTFVVNLFPAQTIIPGIPPGGDDGLPIGMILTAVLVLAGLVFFFWFVFRPKRGGRR